MVTLRRRLRKVQRLSLLLDQLDEVALDLVLHTQAFQVAYELRAAVHAPVHGEFIIMRRWASDTTLDNASGSGRNPKLRVAQIRQHPVLVDVPPSLHACDEH